MSTVAPERCPAFRRVLKKWLQEKTKRDTHSPETVVCFVFSWSHFFRTPQAATLRECPADQFFASFAPLREIPLGVLCDSVVIS
jgi:hypothetical protein